MIRYTDTFIRAVVEALGKNMYSSGDEYFRKTAESYVTSWFFTCCLISIDRILLAIGIAAIQLIVLSIMASIKNINQQMGASFYRDRLLRLPCAALNIGLIVYVCLGVSAGLPVTFKYLLWAFVINSSVLTIMLPYTVYTRFKIPFQKETNA